MMDLRSVFSGKRVLVAGGLGFIGSNLARRLVELGADVLIVDALIPAYGGNPFNIAGIENRVRVNIADVRNESVINHLVQGQDFLFNLVGQVSHTDSMQDPYTDMETNCRAQIALLEACRRWNPEIKIAYAGTRQVYGRPRYLPVDEHHLVEPVDINGVHKIAAEWYHRIYHRVHGLRTVALRLTNTYGPRMRVKDSRHGFIGWWIHQVVRGREIEIFGTGQQIRDFNYVDDVVEALLLAASHPDTDGQVYNLGGDEPISLAELARLLVDVNGGGSYRLVPFPADRQRIDIGDYYGDYSRIRAQLGWRPKVPLREGLARTIAFYREFGDRYW